MEKLLLLLIIGVGTLFSFCNGQTIYSITTVSNLCSNISITARIVSSGSHGFSWLITVGNSSEKIVIGNVEILEGQDPVSIKEPNDYLRPQDYDVRYALYSSTVEPFNSILRITNWNYSNLSTTFHVIGVASTSIEVPPARCVPSSNNFTLSSPTEAFCNTEFNKTCADGKTLRLRCPANVSEFFDQQCEDRIEEENQQQEETGVNVPAAVVGGVFGAIGLIVAVIGGFMNKNMLIAGGITLFGVGLAIIGGSLFHQYPLTAGFLAGGIILIIFGFVVAVVGVSIARGVIKIKKK